MRLVSVENFPPLTITLIYCFACRTVESDSHMKALTRDQLEGRKEKAARFVRDVLGDDDRADEIEDESIDDYAERRKIEIVDNPRRRRNTMARPSYEDLKQENDDLRDQIEDMQAKMDEASDALADDDDDDDNGDDDPED